MHEFRLSGILLFYGHPYWGSHATHNFLQERIWCSAAPSAVSRPPPEAPSDSTHSTGEDSRQWLSLWGQGHWGMAMSVQWGTPQLWVEFPLRWPEVFLPDFAASLPSISGTRSISQSKDFPSFYPFVFQTLPPSKSLTLLPLISESAS